MLGPVHNRVQIGLALVVDNAVDGHIALCTSVLAGMYLWDGVGGQDEELVRASSVSATSTTIWSWCNGQLTYADNISVFLEQLVLLKVRLPVPGRVWAVELGQLGSQRAREAAQPVEEDAVYGDAREQGGQI